MHVNYILSDKGHFLNCDLITHSKAAQYNLEILFFVQTQSAITIEPNIRKAV